MTDHFPGVCGGVKKSYASQKDFNSIIPRDD